MSVAKFVVAPIVVVVGAAAIIWLVRRPALEVTEANYIEAPSRPNEPARYIHKLRVRNTGRSEAHDVRIPVSESAFDGPPSILVEPGVASTLDRGKAGTLATVSVLPPGRSVVVSLFGLLAPGLSEVYSAHRGEHSGREHPGMVVTGTVTCNERGGAGPTRWLSIDQFAESEGTSQFPAFKFLALASVDSSGTQYAPLNVIVAGEGIRALRDDFATGLPGHVPGGLMLVNAALDASGRKVDYLGPDMTLLGLMLPRRENFIAWYYDLRCRVDPSAFSKIGINLGGVPDSARWIRVGAGTWKRAVVSIVHVLPEE